MFTVKMLTWNLQHPALLKPTGKFLELTRRSFAEEIKESKPAAQSSRSTTTTSQPFDWDGNLNSEKTSKDVTKGALRTVKLTKAQWKLMAGHVMR